MRYKKFYLSLFFLLFAANLLNAANPAIKLVEGINKISLSVLNNWESDITGIKVEIDKRKLPVWLSVITVNRTINVQKGMRGSEELILTFNVSDAPLGKFTKIPYAIKDNNGNQWNFSIYSW